MSNIFIVVRPVLSTWVALSSSQEDPPTPPPESASITKLVGLATYPLYSRGDGPMAAAPTTMLREAR